MKTGMLIGMGLFMSLEANAGDILASKEGPFEKFNRCFIQSGSAELQIGFRTGHVLKETSSLYISTSDVEDLAAPAIAGIEREFFRWFPTQTDYKARGAEGSLVPFYSEGFTNIVNNSEASNELRAQIDTICSQIADFRILGKFQVDLKVGDRVFADTLEIERELRSFSTATVKGTYTVPDSFESKIKELKYDNGSFTFTIHVVEGDQDYEAIFEGTLDRQDKLTGAAFILPDRKPLGTFTGRRL